MNKERSEKPPGTADSSSGFLEGSYNDWQWKLNKLKDQIDEMKNKIGRTEEAITSGEGAWDNLLELKQALRTLENLRTTFEDQLNKLN